MAAVEPQLLTASPRAVRVEWPYSFDGKGALQWLDMIEQFFHFYGFTDPYRLKVAAIYFDGPVVPWFQELQQSRLVTSWASLKMAILVAAVRDSWSISNTAEDAHELLEEMPDRDQGIEEMLEEREVGEELQSEQGLQPHTDVVSDDTQESKNGIEEALVPVDALQMLAEMPEKEMNPIATNLDAMDQKTDGSSSSTVAELNMDLFTPCMALVDIYPDAAVAYGAVVQAACYVHLTIYCTPADLQMLSAPKSLQDAIDAEFATVRHQLEVLEDKLEEMAQPVAVFDVFQQSIPWGEAALLDRCDRWGIMEEDAFSFSASIIDDVQMNVFQQGECLAGFSAECDMSLQSHRLLVVMDRRDAVYWNSLISGYCSIGRVCDVGLFRKMPYPANCPISYFFSVYGFGASIVALNAQLAGGLSTLATNLGVDHVGKVEQGIPEDDCNSAVVRDLVGDKVQELLLLNAISVMHWKHELNPDTMPWRPVTLKTPLTFYSYKLFRKVPKTEDSKTLKFIFHDVPGGPEAFELMNRKCYNNGNIQITSINTCLLHLVAQFMAMIADFSSSHKLITQTEESLECITYWTWSEPLTAFKQCQVSSSGVLDKILDSLVGSIMTVSGESPSGSFSDNFALRLSVDMRNTISTKNNHHPSCWFADLLVLNVDTLQKALKSMISRKVDHLAISRLLFDFLRHRYLNATTDEKRPTAEIIMGLAYSFDESSFSYKGLFGILRLTSSNNLSKHCRSRLESMVGSQIDQATLDSLLVPAYEGMDILDDVNLVLSFLRYFLQSGGVVQLVRHKWDGTFFTLKSMFELYSFLCQQARWCILPNHQASDEDLSSYDVEGTSKTWHNSLLKEFVTQHQKGLLVVMLLGTCMTIGDRVLTPTVSVLSVVSSISSKATNLHENYIVTISCTISVVLLSLQLPGTHRIGFILAPIVTAWVLSISGIGMFNIIR